MEALSYFHSFVESKVMKSIHSIVNANLKGKKVVFLFLLSTLVYIFMISVTIPHVMEHARGMSLLDMMPLGYDFEYVQALFNSLGEAGRHAYLYRQIPIDMAYPFLFAITYSLVLAFFLKKLNKLEGPFFYFCLLPFIAGLADYAENFGVVVLLTNYPDFSILSVTITSIFSLTKSCITTIFFLVLTGTLILVALKSINKKK